MDSSRSTRGAVYGADPRRGRDELAGGRARSWRAGLRRRRARRASASARISSVRWPTAGAAGQRRRAAGRPGGRARAAARAGARAPAGRRPRRARRRPRRRARRPRRAAARAVRRTLASAAGWSSRSAGTRPWRARLRANACVGVGRVLAPRQAVLGAPRLGLGAPGAEQRADQPAVARAHPEQRAPAGRGGEPVEHGLDLVGGGVAGGDVGVALRGQPRRLGVAGVARPRLQVALGPARAVDAERHAEPLAQRGAVGGVLGGRVAQAVVDVQRASPRRRSAPRGRAGRPSRRRRRAARRPARPAAAGPPARTLAPRGSLPAPGRRGTAPSTR